MRSNCRPSRGGSWSRCDLTPRPGGSSPRTVCSAEKWISTFVGTRQRGREPGPTAALQPGCRSMPMRVHLLLHQSRRLVFDPRAVGVASLPGRRGADGDLRVVTDGDGAFAAGRHRSGLGVGQRDLAGRVPPQPPSGPASAGATRQSPPRRRNRASAPPLRRLFVDRKAAPNDKVRGGPGVAEQVGEVSVDCRM